MSEGGGLLLGGKPTVRFYAAEVSKQPPMVRASVYRFDPLNCFSKSSRCVSCSLKGGTPEASRKLSEIKPCRYGACVHAPPTF